MRLTVVREVSRKYAPAKVAAAVLVTACLVANSSPAHAAGNRPNADEVALWSEASTYTSTVSGAGSLWVGFRVTACQGWPGIVGYVDGKKVGTATATTTNQVWEKLADNLSAGSHGVTIKLTGDKYVNGSCDRNAFIAMTYIDPSTPKPAATTAAPTTPAPTPTPVAATSTVAGVPAGTTLKVHKGDLNITTNGTVVDGLDVYGRINVRASNVTIRNTRVRGIDISKLPATRYSLVSLVGANNKITNSTLRADYPNPNWNGLTGYGFTATAVDVSNVVDTVMTYGDNVTVANSRLHGNTQWAKDYTWGLGGTPSHSDGWQIEGGSNLVARNNIIDNPQWTGIILTQNVAKSKNITITGNKISGGKCNVNIAEKSRGPITGLRITNNVFGAVNTSAASGGQATPGCHVVATPSSSPTRTDIGNALTGNSSTDGYPVVVKQGS